MKKFQMILCLLIVCFIIGLFPQEICALEQYDNYISEIKELDGIEDKLDWFIAYKDILFNYQDVYDLPENIYDYYDDEEIKLMSKVVETECYQQDFESKCNVASVIFNRIEYGDYFGKTASEVITKPNQFAYFRTEISMDSILALEYVFMIENTAENCYWFNSFKDKSNFYGEYAFTDKCGHNFFKMK